ncbi:MAG TPA: hypothetical protein VJU78_07825, partial [Chitinophagaceae bacterium]|nr:hypothetical protein [Chitinophagaceae bacterium]
MPREITEQRLAQLEKVKNIILADLSKHHPIKKLCQSGAINQLCLKRDFKRVYGTPLYKFLIQERL